MTVSIHRPVRTRELLLSAAIFLAAFLAYLPALRAGFVWDDDAYVRSNSLLWAPNGLQRIWLEPQSSPQYYPLVFTTFRIEHRLWGFNPAGYHAVNILLHAANALLLWRILVFLRVPGGYIAALIFSVHPVHVESVAWVTERKNILSGFFYLAALFMALRFYLAEESEPRRWATYGGALLLFVCALLSKTVTCTLPAAIGLILWWKRGRISRGEALTLLPFLAIGLALALNTAWLEKTHVGAKGLEWNFSFVQRVLIAGRVPWFYLSKLAWPHPLIFIYPRWTVDPAAARQYLFPAATLSALAALWLLRGRIGRGAFAAAVFFVVTLSPALGFFNYYPMRYSFVADHFQYLASIGPIVLAVAAAARRHAGHARWPAIGCACALVAAFGMMTWRQCGDYRDFETLWRETVRKNPSASIAQSALGVIELRQGHMDEAARRLELALSLKADDPIIQYNMGSLRMKQSRLDEAAACFEKAIALRPDHLFSYNDLGIVRMRQGRLDEALKSWKQALSRDPDFAPARSNLGVALLQHGDPAGGIAQLREAIRADPDYATGWYNLGSAMQAQNEPAEALRCFARAAEAQPDYLEARYKLAVLLADGGRPDLAISQFRQLLDFKPDWPPALQALAWLRATCADASFRNGDEAIRLASRAAELTGNKDAAVLDVLAAAYAETGRFGEAAATARKALELAQSSANAPLSDRIRKHLECYSSGRPWRETRPR